MLRARDLLAIPVRRSTWQRFVYLGIGTALIAPFGTLAGFLAPVLEGGLGEPAAWTLASVLCFGPLAMGIGMLASVRDLEIAAVRRLLGTELANAVAPDVQISWATRWRSAGWFVAHLLAGGVIGALTLVLPPAAVSACLAPFASGDVQLGQLDVTVPGGSASAWLVPLALLSPFALIYLAAAASAILARLAPRLLGPSPAELLAVMQREAMRLAERNRLARELHDSVGHALSIVNVQAGAAERVLANDPVFVREALTNIQTAARNGLRDLDHVLGLLREDGAASRAPTPTLADLQRLGEASRSAGIDVTAELTGKIDDVPQAVSREAYRIVQESLTNAARHAGRAPVSLSLNVGADDLELELTNPLGASRPRRAGGGRGLNGIQERVTSLRGQMSAGPDGGRWRVAVRLPLHPTP
ncbi:MAG TPA: histidine kinase [Solirubrobacteraceae bacterium]|nr:histidine kinase [Solirubrobacteraceae bacterium]